MTGFVYCPHGDDPILAALRANPPTGRVVVHVPPPPSHKMTVGDPARTSRVLDASTPTVVAGAEFNRVAWVHASGTWREKGQQFAAAMAATKAATWVLNEAPSGMRKRRPDARHDLADLICGLGTPGIVCQQGVGPLGSAWSRRMYRRRLSYLIRDKVFWRSVGDLIDWYAFETYASPSVFLGWGRKRRERFLFAPLERLPKQHPLREKAMILVSAYGGADGGYGHSQNADAATMVDLVNAQAELVLARGVGLGFAFNGSPPGWTPTDVRLVADAVVANLKGA